MKYEIYNIWMWKLHADAKINCFTWYQCSSWFILFCSFKIWYYKGHHMYCFLSFGFVNIIIFVVNQFGSYSIFVEADSEYPNLLRYDRSSWSWLGYFNFELMSCSRFWWIRNSSDLRRVSGFFNVFKFWNFKTSSICVSHHFQHYIQFEPLLEDYCKSLLVYQ